MKSGSENRYELIFPSLYEEEKNEKYEIFLKKANEIWDEFTTGTKGKKRAAEIAAAEKEKERQEMLARKKKLQAQKAAQERKAK